MEKLGTAVGTAPWTVIADYNELHVNAFTADDGPCMDAHFGSIFLNNYPEDIANGITNQFASEEAFCAAFRAKFPTCKILIRCKTEDFSGEHRVLHENGVLVIECKRANCNTVIEHHQHKNIGHEDTHALNTTKPTHTHTPSINNQPTCE